MARRSEVGVLTNSQKLALAALVGKGFKKPPGARPMDLVDDENAKCLKNGNLHSALMTLVGMGFAARAIRTDTFGGKLSRPRSGYRYWATQTGVRSLRACW